MCSPVISIMVLTEYRIQNMEKKMSFEQFKSVKIIHAKRYHYIIVLFRIRFDTADLGISISFIYSVGKFLILCKIFAFFSFFCLKNRNDSPVPFLGRQSERSSRYIHASFARQTTQASRNQEPTLYCKY